MLLVLHTPQRSSLLNKTSPWATSFLSGILCGMKRTKIVATIGPASAQPKILEKLIRSGMDVARLNFSHGTYAEHRTLIRNIRAAAKKVGHTVAIMQDLQGPRIRIGQVSRDGIEVRRGESVVLVPEHMINYKLLVSADVKIIPHQYVYLYKDVQQGSHILINDGLIDLRVTRLENRFVYAEVEKPGTIFTHKSINLPGVEVSSEVITVKDKQDLKFGLTQDIDYVALSFVKGPEHVRALRKLIPKSKQVLVVSKIERREAVENFKAILEETDGVMVARGDLGIELPPEDVPLIQKQLIQDCLIAAKPVIVATQMLESMMVNPRPTRAEVSDVANAVIDHTDAVMLSGETANGKYPVEAVQMMTRIIEKTEPSPFDDLPESFFQHDPSDTQHGIAHSAYELARDTKAKVIVAASFSGRTARLIARFRPQTPVLVLTDNPKTQQHLALVWGVRSMCIPKVKNLDVLVDHMVRMVKKLSLAKKGQKMVIVSGHPVREEEQMNAVKVHTL